MQSSAGQRAPPRESVGEGFRQFRSRAASVFSVATVWLRASGVTAASHASVVVGGLRRACSKGVRYGTAIGPFADLNRLCRAALRFTRGCPAGAVGRPWGVAVAADARLAAVTTLRHRRRSGALPAFNRRVVLPAVCCFCATRGPLPYRALRCDATIPCDATLRCNTTLPCNFPLRFNRVLPRVTLRCTSARSVVPAGTAVTAGTAFSHEDVGACRRGTGLADMEGAARPATRSHEHLQPLSPREPLR